MTEQDIIDAGFERVDISAKDSGNDNDFYYYTYDFVKGFSLITPASDEIDNGWYAEVFEAPETRITNKAKLFSFIETVNEMINEWQ